MTQGRPVVLVCGNVFDGLSEGLSGSGEILVQDGKIAEVAEEVSHPPDAEIIEFSGRTVMPGFVDTHVHLTMDASGLTQQTRGSAATKALKALNLAREYMGYGFAMLRDLGSMDPQFPTVDLRDALNAGLWTARGSSSRRTSSARRGGHGDVRAFYGPRWDLLVSHTADGAARIKELVRRQHTFGGDWIKTVNAGGYFSPEMTRRG